MNKVHYSSLSNNSQYCFNAADRINKELNINIPVIVNEKNK